MKESKFDYLMISHLSLAELSGKKTFKVSIYNYAKYNSYRNLNV